MVSGVSNVGQNIFEPQIAPPQILQPQSSITDAPESSTSFYAEDNAIISSQAKMLYELDKFNAGNDNLLDLAVSCVVAKYTASAEVNVINTKKEMMDDILKIGE